MAARLVLQGNPREALKKIVDDYQKQEQEDRDLLIETTVDVASKEHPVKFFERYGVRKGEREEKILADEEMKLDTENRELTAKIAAEMEANRENYGKRWKFYIWFGLFTFMVMTGYFLFVLYRVGEMKFIKNP
jgi:DNA polymerase II large subunit